MKKYTSSLAALLLIAGAMTCANAQTNRENYAEINTRNSAGWTIATFYNGNNFHSCGAITIDSDQGMDEMVLEYSGSDWQIARNNLSTGNYQGRIFVGPVQGTLSFEPAGTDVFPMVAHLDRSVIAELKREASFIVEWRFGDRVTYSLSGSSAAMAKTEECFRNQGRKPARQVAQVPLRQNNQQNNSQNREQSYANVKGWSVDAVFVSNGFSYCGATTATRGWLMRIAYQGNVWGIGLETSRTGSMYGQLSVDYSDGRNFQAGSVTYANDGDGWAATGLSWEFIGHLKQGSTVSLDIGDGFKRFSLSGSSAAMLKLEECARNQGRKPARRVAQAPRTQFVQPAQRRQTTQAPRQQNNNVAYKAQLSGTWVWSDPVKNSKNNLIVATIKMTGNNTLNYCYGLFCWDVNFTMNNNNDVQFTTNGVDIFVFYDDGPNALHGEFWENGNSSASPDARVDLR